MGRLRLGVLTAFALLGFPGPPAEAADVTSVASSGEPGDPFDLHLSVRFDRLLERAQIGRERYRASSVNPLGSVVDAEELRYVRKRTSLVPRVSVGIYRDLEVHFEIPYVIYDDRTWRYGQVSGASTEGTSSIKNNPIDAEGQSCDDPGTPTVELCQLFPVDTKNGTTLYHGGHAGDLTAGIAWGIFNDRKDDTKPFWLVGLDITFPTAPEYEPALNLLDSPPWLHTQSAHPARFGEKIWKWDLYTALSRRMGPIEPYVKAHGTAMLKSNSTYSNCRYADRLAALTPKQMTSVAAANCASWASAADAQLPWIAGLSFGTEIIPFADDAQQQKVTIDVRLRADYTSGQRFYNELSDMSGKLHETEGYLTMGGYIGLYLRASKYVALHATASLETETSHFLSGESLGRDGSWPALDPAGTGITQDPALMNPNFDWRYDPPGRRFRLSEVANFDVSLAGVLQF